MYFLYFKISWKECKEKQVDVTHAAFAKFKASLTASSTASAEDKVKQFDVNGTSWKFTKLLMENS